MFSRPDNRTSGIAKPSPAHSRTVIQTLVRASESFDTGRWSHALILSRLLSSLMSDQRIAALLEYPEGPVVKDDVVYLLHETHAGFQGHYRAVSWIDQQRSLRALNDLMDIFEKANDALPEDYRHYEQALRLLGMASAYCDMIEKRAVQRPGDRLITLSYANPFLTLAIANEVFSDICRTSQILPSDIFPKVQQIREYHPWDLLPQSVYSKDLRNVCTVLSGFSDFVEQWEVCPRGDAGRHKMEAGDIVALTALRGFVSAYGRAEESGIRYIDTASIPFSYPPAP